MRRLVGLLVLVLAGLSFSGFSCRREQATVQVEAIEAGVINYSKNMSMALDAMIEKWKEDRRKEERVRYTKVLKSILGSGNTPSEQTVQALNAEHFRRLLAIEREAALMKGKSIKAYQDVEIVLRRSDALKEYFGQEASKALGAQQALDMITKMILGMVQDGENVR